MRNLAIEILLVRLRALWSHWSREGKFLLQCLSLVVFEVTIKSCRIVRDFQDVSLARASQGISLHVHALA